MPNLKKLLPAVVVVATALFACEMSENKGPEAMQSSELGLGADHAFQARSTIADGKRHYLTLSESGVLEREVFTVAAVELDAHVGHLALGADFERRS